MKAVFAVIFFVSSLIFLTHADTSFAYTCASRNGICQTQSFCDANDGTRDYNATGCTGGNICCAWTPPPANTPVPPPRCVTQYGGVCWSTATCTANGGVSIGTQGCNSGICCTFPPPTPTKTPVPPPSCSSLGGQCWPGPRNLCIAEGGEDRTATGCGGSTPICCVLPAIPTPTPTRTPTPTDTPLASAAQCVGTGGFCTSPFGCDNLDGGIYRVDNRSVVQCTSNSSTACCAHRDIGARCDSAGGTLETGSCSSDQRPVPNFPNSGGKVCCRLDCLSNSTPGLRPNLCTTASACAARPESESYSADNRYQCQNSADVCCVSNSTVCPAGNCVGGGGTCNSPSRWFSEVYGYEFRCHATTSQGNLTVGRCCIPPSGGGSGVYTISGQVFIDSDGDGVKDANENQGVGDITVQISTISLTTTTGSNGDFSLGGLSGAGTYRVSISGIPTGYGAPNGTSVNVTMNNANRTVDLAVARTYTISGSVLVDSAGTESNYTGNIAIDSNPAGIVTTPSGTGDYTVSNLLAGTYTISFTNKPQAYPVVIPPGSPPSFSVTVGTSCSVANSNQTGASCSGGNIINLNFAMRTEGAWIQIIGGNSRVDDGHTNFVPSSSLYQPYSAVGSE